MLLLEGMPQVRTTEEGVKRPDGFFSPLGEVAAYRRDMWWLWATAGAFELEGGWDPERLPLVWCAEGESEAWSEEDLAVAVALATAAWERPESCVPQLFVRADTCADADVRVAADTDGTVGSGTTHVVTSQDDPQGFYDRYEVVYSSELDWLLPGETCEGDDIHLTSILVHQLGHALGLGHSCEQDEICLDTDELEAAMYWSMLPCTEVVPNADDHDGVEALYCGGGAADDGDGVGGDGTDVRRADDHGEPSTGCNAAGTSMSLAALAPLLFARRRRSDQSENAAPRMGGGASS